MNKSKKLIDIFQHINPIVDNNNLSKKKKKEKKETKKIKKEIKKVKTKVKLRTLWVRRRKKTK